MVDICIKAAFYKVLNLVCPTTDSVSIANIGDEHIYYIIFYNYYVLIFLSTQTILFYLILKS